MTKRNGHPIAPTPIVITSREQAVELYGEGSGIAKMSPSQGPHWRATHCGAQLDISGFENRWFLARAEAVKRFSAIGARAVSADAVELVWRDG